MAPTHVKAKSLSGKIFSSVLAFTTCVIVVLACVLTTIFYMTYEDNAERTLRAEAQNAAEALNASPSSANVPALSEQFSADVRYTLVAKDGMVLYDSDADAGAMDNHGQRPEIVAATQAGIAVTDRYSDTLKTDTLYAAVLLDDGSVIRLAETRTSLLAFLGDMIPPIAVALSVAVVFVFLLSRVLTRRIMKPIDALDFASPLENDIYEEMDPLLIRIDEQQRQLKQQNIELAAAENMRRDFSSNVSHEMKTPLQVISGYAELMMNDMVKPDDRQKIAGLVYDEARAMRSLIDDVLTLSRLDETAFGEMSESIDMHAVALRVANRIGSFAADKGVEVVVEGESACIAGNATLAEEMIYNLVENGIRYNNEGGQVVVSVRREEHDGAAPEENAVAPQQAGVLRKTPLGETTGARGQIVIRVRDTGPGIPEQLHDKIFERFFRLEKSRSKETGGTGLGLAIVKHAVMYHGGTIQVESAEGFGTTFVLRLPEDARDSK